MVDAGSNDVDRDELVPDPERGNGNRSEAYSSDLLIKMVNINNPFKTLMMIADKTPK